MKKTTSENIMEGLPNSFLTADLLRARIDEIEGLAKLIETPSNNIILKKEFPKHMRRRAMSQNVKRVPKRLQERQIEMREKSGIKEVPPKRPRRKYRRRRAELLKEYNRRQRENVWLETHIWHAKRFHMVTNWGYKLPFAPIDKNFRFCYRATTTRSLIQDMSYYCCLELSGIEDDLLKGLKMHVGQDNGLSFGSVQKRTGLCEGACMFFNSDKYPAGAIGEVKFLWRPIEADTPQRTLWIWVHPSYHLQVLGELKSTFALEPEEPMETQTLAEEKEKEKNIEAIKLEMRNVPFVRTPKYYNMNNSIKLFDLKDTLNRIRVTGPLALSTIKLAFKVIDLSKRDLNDWCTRHYTNANREISQKQLEFWTKDSVYMETGYFPSHTVLGLTIIDPRLTMPAHKTKSLLEVLGDPEQPISVEEALSHSPIWCSMVRDEVTNSKLSMHQINEARSQKLVHGIESELRNNPNLNNLPVIPILLLQQPGSNCSEKPNGYGAAWDIISPAGCGLPLWLGLWMHGATGGGLKEGQSILREQGRLGLSPDTDAGRSEAQARRISDTEKYFGLPPAKRPNFIKLGFPTPFHCPWNVLIRDWTGNTEFKVLRNLLKLQEINHKLKQKDFVIGDDDKYNDTIVPVLIQLKDKGIISNNSYLYIPKVDDYVALAEDRKYTGPIEPAHLDLKEGQRSSMRSTHKALLKTLSRKRQKARKGKVNLDPLLSQDIISKNKESMRELWLPECTTLKDENRLVIGSVVNGDFSFCNAASCGVGYVSFMGLKSFFQFTATIQTKGPNFILIRNPNSSQYRFAQMSVIL